LEKNAQNCPENDSISRKSSNTEFTMYNVVMAMLAKRKRTKASIINKINEYLFPVDYYSTVLYHLAINIMEIRRKHDFKFKHSSI
jgi:endo-1,4-beta-D-glucanase Y